MKFEKAMRKKAKLRLALTGPSGSGKTYSALLVAKGIGGKVAFIDTEKGSASLYSDIADFDVLELDPPFSPERFIEAIKSAEDAGYETLVLDSITHEWGGVGGCLELVDTIAKAKYRGNSWSAWSEINPRHRLFLDAILRSPMHIIATMRSKTETAQVEENGRKKVAKLGMKSEQRDGVEYEFTTVLDTGAINIYACRIPTAEVLSGGAGGLLSHQRDGTDPVGDYEQAPEGRWPANIIHDGSDEVISCFPANARAAAPVTGNEPSAASTGHVLGLGNRVATVHHGDKGSAARFFYCAKVKPKERDEGLERFIATSASDMTGGRKEGSVGINDPRAGAGRTKGAKNNHPTVKPIALMSYLCKLITPPGGTVLDPWMGSGSTGRAAIEEGFNFIGIDLNPHLPGRGLCPRSLFNNQLFRGLDDDTFHLLLLYQFHRVPSSRRATGR